MKATAVITFILANLVAISVTFAAPLGTPDVAIPTTPGTPPANPTGGPVLGVEQTPNKIPLPNKIPKINKVPSPNKVPAVNAVPKPNAIPTPNKIPLPNNERPEPSEPVSKAF